MECGKRSVVDHMSNVTHPAHYNAGKIEVIEFIEDQGLGTGFCRGNAIKYLARAGKKDAAKELEDLEKAAWYLAREIEMLKALSEKRSPKRPNDMNPVVDSKLTKITESHSPPLTTCPDCHVSEGTRHQPYCIFLG
jgi:Protein of unknwon function (DUF3310)